MVQGLLVPAKRAAVESAQSTTADATGQAGSASASSSSLASIFSAAVMSPSAGKKKTVPVKAGNCV